MTPGARSSTTGGNVAAGASVSGTVASAAVSAVVSAVVSTARSRRGPCPPRPCLRWRCPRRRCVRAVVGLRRRTRRQRQRRGEQCDGELAHSCLPLDRGGPPCHGVFTASVPPARVPAPLVRRGDDERPSSPPVVIGDLTPQPRRMQMIFSQMRACFPREREGAGPAGGGVHGRRAGAAVGLSTPPVACEPNGSVAIPRRQRPTGPASVVALVAGSRGLRGLRDATLTGRDLEGRRQWVPSSRRRPRRRRSTDRSPSLGPRRSSSAASRVRSGTRACVTLLPRG